jgi:hypothetical protein
LVGIDPSESNGGIAVKHEGYSLHNMPKGILKKLIFFRDLQRKGSVLICQEHIWAMQKSSKGSAKTEASFMQHIHELKIVYDLLGIDYLLVPPVKWMNDLDLRVKGDTYKVRKERFKTWAIEQGVKATLSTADAYCILRWVEQADQKYFNKKLVKNHSLLDKFLEL